MCIRLTSNVEAGAEIFANGEDIAGTVNSLGKPPKTLPVWVPTALFTEKN